MQSSTREMQSSSGQIALPELSNGQQQQQQIQNGGMQVPAGHFDHSAAAAHDDFFDQMLSTLPSTWPDLGNPKSPWDLAAPNPNGSGAAAADMSNVQKLFSLALAGKSQEEPVASGEGLHYAPYDESSLLASRLRQHQISGDGGSPGGKPMLLQLNHHHPAQQQQMLLPAMGRSPAASALGGGSDAGLLPLPLCLASGGSADSRLLGSREEVDASFKSPNSTGGDGLYNGFGGSLQRGASQTAGQHHFQQPQGGSTQSYGGAPAAGPGGGGTAPPRQRVRARRGQATDPHSIAERLRRERIAERMKALQELVPNANKTDKASMLDEIIDYVKFLQLQVKVLSMSRLGGAAAVAPLVADVSSEAGRGGGGSAAAGSDSLAVTEHQVAKLMEEDMGSAMQYLQGKGLCLMPISLASAISTATCHPRVAGGGGGILGGNPGLIPAPPPGGDGPSSPSMSVLTVQSAMANGAEADVSRSSASGKDAASVSKP